MIGVHLARLDELFRAVKNLQPFCTVRFEFMRRSAAHGGQRASREFAGEQAIGMVLADVAHAHDADSNGVHFRFILPVNSSSARSRVSYTLRSASMMAGEQTDTARACSSVKANSSTSD